MACKKKDKPVVPGNSLPSVSAIAGFASDSPTIKNITSPPLPQEFDLTVATKLVGEYNNGTLIKNPRKATFPEASLKINKRATAIGKNLTVINSELLGPPEKERNDGITFSANPVNIKDPFRLATGKYWAIDKGNLEYMGEIDSPITIIDYDAAPTPASKPTDVAMAAKLTDSPRTVKTGLDSLLGEFQLPPPKTSDSLDTFFGTKQWVAISATQKYFSDNTPAQGRVKTRVEQSIRDRYENKQTTPVNPRTGISEDRWESFIKGGAIDRQIQVPAAIKTGEIFFDHAFIMPTPFSKQELENYTGLNAPLRANISSRYNFYISTYENNQGAVPENLLPNLYVAMTELNKDTNDPRLSDSLTLAGEINPRKVALNATSRREGDMAAQKVSREYFKEFSRAAFNLLIPKAIESRERVRRNKEQKIKKIVDSFKNIAIPMSDIDLLKDYYDKRYLFPMFAELDIPTDKTTVLAQILQESQLSTSVMTNLISSLESPEELITREFIEESEVIQQIKSKSGSSSVLKSALISNQDRKMWDITQWLKEFADTNSQQNIDNIAVFLGNDSGEKQLASTPEYQFFRNLMKIVFVGKMRSLVKDKMRTFEQMLSGQPAYNETVMYKIEKFKADQDGRPRGSSIQSFYFPNSNDLDILKYIDTQVKYGVHYAYKVFAYQMVIGTEYSYDSLEVREGISYFSVTQKPSIVLIETPYYTYSTLILDKPPMPPEVSIIPYMGSDKDFLIWFNAGYGEQLTEPIFIESEDQAKMQRYRQAKGLDKDEKILFRTDDHAGVYQIFRLEYHPENYSDFAGNLLAAVETDIVKNTEQKATTASFRELVEPNKKYYYIFRVVDNHGHISNPSSIYQVELVNNSGAVYPLIKTVELKEKLKKMPSRVAKKYLKIKPTFNQETVNEERSGLSGSESVRDIQNIFLGVEEEGVFGKSFKIRLTSRNTGKKIDFNITFKQNFIRTKLQSDA